MATYVATEQEKARHYHRLIELHINCGGETLRRYFDTMLVTMGKSLDQFLTDPSTKFKIPWSQLNSTQKYILKNSADLNSMDVTLLTTLILQTSTPLGHNKHIYSCIENLRKERNKMAHVAKAEIDSSRDFNRGSQLIQQIASSVSDGFKKTIISKMNELRDREMVRTCSNVDKVLINGEYFMCKLVETDETEPVDGAGNVTLIRFNLSKWIRQLTRGIDTTSFLRKLKGANVITEEMQQSIESEYNKGDQMHYLVRYVQESISEREHICKFCKCLRELDPNMANLIENDNSDGEQIELFLKEKESSRICQVLQDNLVPQEAKYVNCEDIHIKVETELGIPVTFDVIVDNFHKTFPEISYTSYDPSFMGVTWKLPETEQIPVGDSVENTEQESKIEYQDMSSEEFAEHAGNRMPKTQSDLRTKVETAFLTESISASTFVTMEKSVLKDVISEYLDGTKYGYGIERPLLDLQREIKERLNCERIPSDHKTRTLRPFDCPPAVNLRYRLNANVYPPDGNLLVPVHEYRMKEKWNCHWIAKEVLRFSAACMNGRKNGTMHFGIRKENNGSGTVLGIPTTRISRRTLNHTITDCIEECFPPQYVRSALYCTRSVQEIPLEDSTLTVIEVDVVPSSTNFWFDNLMPIRYPPKGPQSDVFVIYDQKPRCEILSVEKSKTGGVRDVYSNTYKERIRLENGRKTVGDELVEQYESLVRTLTGGSKYVTDERIPVVILGNMAGCQNENEVRGQVCAALEKALPKIVLDFGSSISLRNQIEQESKTYNVKTAEDFIRSANQYAPDDAVWIYCNGIEENGSERLEISEWNDKREPGVKTAINIIRKLIPISRALVIFLLFQSPIVIQKDPIFEIARDAMVSRFKGECMVIANDADFVSGIKNEVSTVVGKKGIGKWFHTGLPWQKVCKALISGFRPKPNVICRLPTSNGAGTIDMTIKEKAELKLTDIEIISGEECEHEEQRMSRTEVKNQEQEIEQTFYKGSKVSWWNFYFNNQVGERNVFKKHLSQIKEKLHSKDREELIGVQKVEHHPGAGGTTLGLHLLWHMSQFKSTADTRYRCCVVKNITDQTAEQIVKFRDFKDSHDALPFIVLVDNVPEDSYMLLMSKLDEAAYKYGSPGNLFCLVVKVIRVPISCQTSTENCTLEHELTGSEARWFDKKYKELERNDNVDVQTLIAFNVMRRSFDKQYIKELTAEMMKGVTMQEKEVLKSLSLICTFESDWPVPQSIYDQLMDDQVNEDVLAGKPFGITYSMKERNKMSRGRNFIWNANMSNAMSLLVTKRDETDFSSSNSGISIISQPLAREILLHLMKSDKLELVDMVDVVLTKVEEHIKEDNPMSTRFTKLVCSLFKTRQYEESDRGERKMKFSDLILELQSKSKKGKDKTMRYQMVLKPMKRCFQITEDAMVGQQLARFNIHITDYAAAEEAIQESLAKKSKSSYLLDTYGQIFKSQMEDCLESFTREERIEDTTAADIANLAFKAIEKFKEGQVQALELNEDTTLGIFQREIKTVLKLLENFFRFECHPDRKTFLKFLNDETLQLEHSDFSNLHVLCPKIVFLRSGHLWQKHIETSLRSMEEMNYQIKKRLYVVQADSEKLLLKLRERFERFYGPDSSTGKLQFRFGIGLKPLMMAAEKEPNILAQRVDEAKAKLTSPFLNKQDMRDLLVYLGSKIISFSSQTPKGCTHIEYQKLLKYSTDLLVEQREHREKNVNIYLESYLYHAMLHWPLPSRISLHCESLTRGDTYRSLIDEWKTAFDHNHNIKTQEQRILKKPKNFFALGTGTPGNDIVDLESIRKRWRDQKKETEGRSRRPVLADQFWREPFVEAALKRLDGTVEGNGHELKHTVSYQEKQHTFKISTYYPCHDFSNRKVTFVLGFTWRGPSAFDVKHADSTGTSEKGTAPENVIDVFLPNWGRKNNNGAIDSTGTSGKSTAPENVIDVFLPNWGGKNNGGAIGKGIDVVHSVRSANHSLPTFDLLNSQRCFEPQYPSSSSIVATSTSTETERQEDNQPDTSQTQNVQQQPIQLDTSNTENVQQQESQTGATGGMPIRKATSGELKLLKSKPKRNRQKNLRK